MNKFGVFLLGGAVFTGFTLLYLFTPFGGMLLDTLRLAGVAIVDFVLFAPIQFFSGIIMTAFIFVAGHRIFNLVGKSWFKSKTIAYVPQNQPTFNTIAQPQQTVAPAPALSAPATTTVLVDPKKVA